MVKSSQDKDVYWLIYSWCAIGWQSLNCTFGPSISNTTDNHNTSHLKNDNLQLQISSCPSVMDPNMCHTHTQICAHTAPLSRRPWGVQAPLSWLCRTLCPYTPTVRDTGVPSPVCSCGPTTSCHPQEVTLHPRVQVPGVPLWWLWESWRWLPGHPRGGRWHCQAPAEPSVPWGHIKQGHTSPDGCCWHSRVSPHVTSVYASFILLFRLVPVFQKYHGNFLVTA